MALQATPTSAMQQAPQRPYYEQFNRTTNNPSDINSIVGGMVDRSPWKWWDTWTQPLESPAVAVRSQIDFFQVAMFQQDPITLLTKTKTDTNMTQSGQFSPPYCLVMESMSFYITSSDVQADTEKVFEKSYWEFKILGKVFFEGLCWMLPSGGGLFGGVDPSGSTSALSNGFPAPQATYRVGKYARYIPPLTQFSMRIFFPGTPPTLSEDFKMVCYLDGLSDNPVQ